MDAFAVSIGKGLCLQRLKFSDMCLVGLWFGGFQALMPAIGFFVGAQFRDRIEAVDHWIAFVLLCLIGIQMLREAGSKEEETMSASLAFREMFLLAVATSIDALAAGVTFAFLHVRLWQALLCIGLTTFVISAAGVRIGHEVGLRYKKASQIAGGIILILIGAHILVSHLFFS